LALGGPANADEAPDPSNDDARYVVRYDHWSDTDERGYGEFIAALGHADCATVNRCLHDPANPFRASDPDDVVFRSDCADLPYVLRFYYAWKRGLPFGFVSQVEPRGATHDIRYTTDGNEVAAREDARDAGATGYAIIDTIRDAVSSATYRIHPDLETPLPDDLYSPALTAKSIRPGTVIYDPNGHLGIVYEVEANGRIHFIDAHPDNALTRGVYDQRFVRSRPGMGAGFKNWRAMRLDGATRAENGVYEGGMIALTPNAEIADFSLEQFFGNGPRPADDSDWQDGPFALNGEELDYYDYLRAKLAGGKLEFDPVKEVSEMVASNCADLHYRVDAVELARSAGLANEPEPARLPYNIYGAEGDWEIYSTPSRDARLKTAFKELRDMAERFVRMWRGKDAHLLYKGRDLPLDLIAAYDLGAAACRIAYVRSDGSSVSLSYEEARKRLFLMSFDPYQCLERRWGATEPRELATCKDDAIKQAWYAAEQNLRNQIERTYDARMDFGLAELAVPGPGKGVGQPPDIDARAYLVSQLAGNAAH
jgi:hypothetical protein